MESKIRAWRISDANDLADALNNKKVLDNLRDGLPFPYTPDDAQAYIMSMLPYIAAHFTDIYIYDLRAFHASILEEDAVKQADYVLMENAALYLYDPEFFNYDACECEE